MPDPHSEEPVAVLLTAVGGPRSLDEVEGFLKDIRHGRETSGELVAEFRERYRRIGGRSPLLEISRAQAAALEKQLSASGARIRVYVGMRNWHPYIRDVLRQISADGVRRLVVLPLTPYFSKMSVGAYHATVLDGIATQNLSLEVRAVESWNDVPALAEAYARKAREGLAALEAEEFLDPVVVFTAHSLPKRVLEEGDPYERELKETMAAVVARLPPLRSRFCYQSVGRTSEAWLGPDLDDVLQELARSGERAVLLVPLGFVSDHIETLYDLDIEARARAEKLGLRFLRSESLNVDPGFVEAMAEATRRGPDGP